MAGALYQPAQPCGRPFHPPALPLARPMQLALLFPRPFWPEDVEVLNRVPPADAPGAWAETYSLLKHTGARLHGAPVAALAC